MKLLLALLLAGCVSEQPTILLADWELDVDGQSEHVHLPRGDFGHGLTEHASVYRLRTRVPIAQAWRGKDITFGLPFFRAHVELLVDGRSIPSLDEHAFDRLRPVVPQRFRIDGLATDEESLELELVVTSTWFQSGGIVVVPRLSLGPYGDPWTRFVRYFNIGTEAASLVALLTLSLLFFLMHATTWRSRTIGVHDPKNLELARIAAGGALYAATQLGVLQPLVGHGDMGFLFAAVLWTAMGSAALARSYVGLPPLNAAVSWIVRAFFVIAPLAGRYLPFVGFGWTLTIPVTLTAAAAYLVLVTRKGSNLKATMELYSIVGFWLLTAILSFFDSALALGIGAPLGGIQVTSLVLIFFALGQAFLLSRQHARLVRDLAARVIEVERRSEEVGLLNIELQRKIGDRSRELSVALRRMKDGSGGELVVGTVLGDHYRVVARLGAGAMGEVYRVERLADGRSLAAKVVRGRMRAESLERFTREVELAARIDHPNVVRVLDVDVTSEGELFLAMELVDGTSLEEHRARFGDRAFAMPVLAQMAAGLRAIHAGGVFHRDLKPSNVLLDDRGHAKIADFGIAGVDPATDVTVDVVPSSAERPAARSVQPLGETLDAASSPKLTRTGAILGTPLYMAPELLHGGAVGPSADLYSFGLIAHQLLGGGALEHAGFRRARLKPFAELARDLPALLVDALDRCIGDDPAKRPTAAHLEALFSS